MLERLGRYELLSRLGVGGMAEVFLARSLGASDFTQRVVVKRMLPQVAENPESVKMFLDEARLGAKLKHPNLLPVLDLGLVDGMYFMALEYVDGADMGAVESRARARGQPLSPEVCAFLVARSAEGLHAAHTAVDPETKLPLNVVHRDVSPSNILVSRTGEVKVSDFGVARSATQVSRTATGALKGKLSYMAPEQVETRSVTPLTDVYALGVVLFELLVRRRLFHGMGEAQVVTQIMEARPPRVSVENPDVDRVLEDIVVRAMARKPADRFPNARAMADALDLWASTKGFSGRTRLERYLEERPFLFEAGGKADSRTPARSPRSLGSNESPDGLRKARVPGGATQATTSLTLAIKADTRRQDVILYVEDEPDNREVAALRLRRRYELLLAENDQQACDILASRGSELSAILMDIQLKGSTLDGIQLVKLLRGKLEKTGLPSWARAVPTLATVPVLFVTAYSARYSEAELIAAGGNRLVTKPVNFSELTLALVDLHLKRVSRP